MITNNKHTQLRLVSESPQSDTLDFLRLMASSGDKLSSTVRWH